MSADHKARGGVSEAEIAAAAEAIMKGTRCVFRCSTDRNHGCSCRQNAITALEAAAQVRAGQGHGGEVEVLKQRLAEWKQAAHDNAQASDAASARAAKVVEVLRRPDVQWAATYVDPMINSVGLGCPVCRTSKALGYHASRCAIGTLLSYHPAPEPGVEVGEVRNAVLEEAAKVADDQANEDRRLLQERLIDHEAAGAAILTSVQIAKAIRALQTPAIGGRDGK